MKALDGVAMILLIIGGLNWGLIGLFAVNLIGLILGDMSFVSRLIYLLVGLSAVYMIVTAKAIYRRWLY